MNITLYETDALFSDLCAEWDDLLADSASDWIVFLTCDWLKTWWEVYSPGRLYGLALRDEATNRLDGIAPWFMVKTEEGQWHLYPIGCVDVTDYLDVIARRGQEEAVAEALAGWLADRAADFDKLELCNFPEESPTLVHFPAALKARGFEVVVEIEDVCPVIPLPDQWLDYFKLLDKKNRHEVRRKLRRAASAVDWYIVGPDHDLEAEIERFLTLMAASNDEKAEFLNDLHNRAFFGEMIPVMAEHGWLQLAFLTVNGEAAATYLNFVYANRVLVYNSGHNPDDHGALSPGIVLLARLIEHAIGENYAAFDFLRGDEQYKYDMGGQTTTVFRLTVESQ